MIRLNKGLAVFPPTMTTRTEAGKLKPESRGFAQVDFPSLQLHHDERVRQIHAMAEYAQHGLWRATDHLNLTMDCFSLTDDSFLERWLPSRL